MFLLPFGQGKPLPSDFPWEGQWLIENRVFIHRPKAGLSLSGSAPRFTASGPSDDGLCFGFDVEHLAAALGIGSDEVFEANQSGELILGKPESVAPPHGGLAATEFSFCYRDRIASFTIEHDNRSGSA